MAGPSPAMTKSLARRFDKGAFGAAGENAILQAGARRGLAQQKVSNDAQQRYRDERNHCSAPACLALVVELAAHLFGRDGGLHRRWRWGIGRWRRCCDVARANLHRASGIANHVPPGVVDRLGSPVAARPVNRLRVAGIHDIARRPRRNNGACDHRPANDAGGNAWAPSPSVVPAAILGKYPERPRRWHAGSVPCESRICQLAWRIEAPDDRN